MDNKQLLDELSQKIESGELNAQEVKSRLGLELSERAEDSSQEEKKGGFHFTTTKTLYGVGIVIALIGIIIFIAQIWEDLGSFGHVFVTLGMGLILTLLGSYFYRTKPETYLGKVFHIMGGLLIPGGAFVLLGEINVDYLESLWSGTMTFGALSVFYIALTFAHKDEVPTFFAIANSTAFIYLLVAAMLEGSSVSFSSTADVYRYLTMAVGVGYVLLGRSFRTGWNSRLVDVLYLIGSAGFMGAVFSNVFESMLWQLLMFVIVIAGTYVAINIKSKNILFVSTTFLIIHIIYITNEYFADSFGWPISLIVLGFIIIGLGYGSVSLSKKYISSNNA